MPPLPLSVSSSVSHMSGFQWRGTDCRCTGAAAGWCFLGSRWWKEGGKKDIPCDGGVDDKSMRKNHLISPDLGRFYGPLCIYVRL